MKNRIFSTDNPKAAKARGFGWLNAIHYMAPHALAGVGNLCPRASDGCKALCLGFHSGQAAWVKRSDNVRSLNEVRKSRIAKARRFMRNRQEYLNDIVRSIELAQSRAARAGLQLAVRLNGSSDVAWESVRMADGMSLIERFPEVQFVDYTKIVGRMLRPRPANYHLCFSRSETNERECREVLAHGGTVAVVFAGDKPVSYLGVPTIDGDKHDLRHLDAGGVVVALSPKGRKAKRDRSGFVVR